LDKAKLLLLKLEGMHRRALSRGGEFYNFATGQWDNTIGN